ncbi:lysophospholipase L1-like esterase [Paenibacillus sp. DS2015]|uniref:rhamnogalacturonan acetylesterase n=1 Tax=Paenibacillus sp. DS2015 TaxID=3373917 RepID=UPI003D1B486E
MNSVNREWAFDFGPGQPMKGYIGVSPQLRYDEEVGYGFEGNGQVNGRSRRQQELSVGETHHAEEHLIHSFCIPIGVNFVVKVPDGTYRVIAQMGDLLADTLTVLKAGESKAVLPPIPTIAGQFRTVMFTVPVRGGKLVLRFSGAAPRINVLNVSSAEETLTIFLAGDSTVTDQPSIGYPNAGWGQMLPQLFKHDVVVDNHAESGRSSRSFIDEGRLESILEKMKAEDFLFIQFGHNDEKSDIPRGTEPFTTYKQYLKLYIDAARDQQARPVLVTPVHRRYFNEDGTLSDTHGDYIIAMKELAMEEDVPLIDLAAESKLLYEAAGIEGSKDYFMWSYPGEYMNHSGGVEDNTHFQERGALRLAELVIEGIIKLDLQPLRMYVR